MSDVVFFDYFYSFGGAQRSTATLLNHFKDSGRARSLFISPSPPSEAFAGFLRGEIVCLYPDRRPALENSRGRPLAFLRDLAGLVARLARLILQRQLASATFVTSSPKGLVTLALTRLVAARGLRIAFYCRGEGKAEHFGRLSRMLMRRDVDRVLCVSAETRKNLERWGAPAARLHTVYTSVDVAPLLAQGAVLPPPDPRRAPVQILFAASLIPQKGLHLLLEGLGMMTASRPIRLLVAGDVPTPAHQDYRDRCVEAAARLPATVAVEWLGWVSEVQPLMAQADIVCLPTATEGFPRLIVEAMAMGRLAVASHVGGVKELIVDGETGFVIELDAAAIAAVLDRILAGTTAEAVSRAARARIQDQYALDIQAGLVLSALAA